jgi:hypothetical protein
MFIIFSIILAFNSILKTMKRHSFYSLIRTQYFRISDRSLAC